MAAPTQRVAAARNYCESCGRPVPAGAASCQNCAAVVAAQAVPAPSRPSAGYASPPPQTKTPSSKKKLVAVAVVAVVVIAALAAVIVFSSSGGSSTPSAIYEKTASPGGWTITISEITKTDVGWDDVKVRVSEGTDFVEWETQTIAHDEGNTVAAIYGSRTLGGTAVMLQVSDVTGNGFVGAGDYFELMATFDSGTDYSTVLIYEPSDERMGDGITFVG